MLETLQVKTSKRNAMVDVTDLISRKVHESGVKSGFCILHVPHTTAAIIVNEGADPAVVEDVIGALDKLIPWEAGYHHQEGNAAAHIKAILTGGRTFVVVENGQLVLGTWERIFFCEFDGPRTRKIYLKIIGDR